MILFLVFYFLFFIYLSWRNIALALFLIIAFLPSYLIRFHIGGIPITALEGMILIVFVVWLIKDARFQSSGLKKLITSPAKAGYGEQCLPVSQRRASRFSLTTSIVLFFLAAVTALFVGPDWHAAAGIWKAYFLEPILFLIVFVSTCASPSSAHSFKVGTSNHALSLVFKALGFSAFYISLYALAQRFLGLPIPPPWQSELRVTSIFPYPNAVGLFLAPIIVLLIGWSALQFVRFRTIFRPIVYYLLPALLAIIAVVLSRTEAAWIAVIAGLIFLFWLWSKKTRKAVLVLTFLFFIFYILFPILFPNSNLFSATENKLLLGDWSGFVRKTIWTETWEMLKDHAIFGAGLSGYQEAILPYHASREWMEIFLYPHNIFLNFWSETGLLGLLAFLWILFEFFKQGINWGGKFCFAKFTPPTLPLLGRGFQPHPATKGSSPFGNPKFLVTPPQSGGGYKPKIKLLKTLPACYGLLSAIIIAAMVTLLVHGLVDVPYFKNDLAILFWTIIGLMLISSQSKMVKT